MTVATVDKALLASLAQRRPLVVALVLATGAFAGIVAGSTAPPASLMWLVLFVVLAAAAIRPDITFLGMVAMAFLLPFAIVPIRLGVQPPIFELGLAATVASALLRSRPFANGPPKLSLANPHFWVTGFLVAGLVSTAISLSRSWDVQQLQYAAKLGLGVTAFYLAANWSRRRGFARKLTFVIATAGALQAVLATAMYFNSNLSEAVFGWVESVGYPTASAAIRYLPDGETVRAVGTAVDPNVLGATLAIAVVIAASLASSSRRGRAVLWWIVVLAIIPALAFSMSRGAWLGAAFGAFGLVWYRRPAIAWAILIVGAAAVAIPTRLSPLEHLRSGLLARDPASALRLEEIRRVPDVVGASPAFGLGFLTEPVARYSLEISNALLWIAERTGLVGAAFYLVATASILATSLRKFRTRPNFIGFLAAFIAASVAGLVDHHIVSMPHLVATYWLLAGTLVGVYAAERVPSRA